MGLSGDKSSGKGFHEAFLTMKYSLTSRSGFKVTWSIRGSFAFSNLPRITIARQ
jgi:hypothetical protein